MSTLSTSTLLPYGQYIFKWWEETSRPSPSLLREYGITATALREAITHIQSQGFTCGLSDKILPLYTGVAVPIGAAEGAPFGALSSAMPTARLTESYQQRLVDAMQREASVIAERLGTWFERA